MTPIKSKSKLLLVFVSDIHVHNNMPENQGLVLNAFIKDLKNQLSKFDYDNLYMLIGGDIVQSADEKENYNLFNSIIITELTKFGIDLEHIIIVPGNHDIERNWINKNKDFQIKLVNEEFSEENFNNFLEQNKDSFSEKFSNYLSFVQSDLNKPDYNILGGSVDLDKNWSLFYLNSALFSSAGMHLNGISCPDLQRMRLPTRIIYSWLEKTPYKRRILLMHHPISYFLESDQEELKKFAKNNFEIILTGHTHSQNVLNNIIGKNSYLLCQAPQLFTDKRDECGYCLINIEDDINKTLIYRQWSNRRNSFTVGDDFTESEDGVVHLQGELPIYDPYFDRIKQDFEGSMLIFGNGSRIWIERYFTKERFDRSFSINTCDLISEDDIMQTPYKYKIISPAEFGLSCFATHFVYELWIKYKQRAVLLDCNKIKSKVIADRINDQIAEFNYSIDELSWILLDNWKVTNKEAKLIMSDIEHKFPNANIILLCPVLEKFFNDNETITNNDYGFVNLYMTPLQTSQLRELVEVYNKQDLIGEDDVVLKRLNDDIQIFNMHKTPLNCISLLEVFKKSFDENPINRTMVVEKLLHMVFDKEIVPTYRSLPDVKDCEFALGFFCQKLVESNDYIFTEEYFCDQLSSFCKEQKISLEINYLFDILNRNQIITRYSNNTYNFRFAFWVYYFLAMRMTKSDDFRNYIFQNETYAHFPEIVEFYTGSDRARTDAANVLLNDLDNIIKCVEKKIGIEKVSVPFYKLKIKPSESSLDKAFEQLDSNIKSSKLPNKVKDAWIDKQYNPSLPYHQEIYKVLKDYSVLYLQEICSIASKTLRNSDYIDPSTKEKLIDVICAAWLTTVKVIYLMSPVMALNGCANIDGFSLKLDSSFDKTENKKDLLLKIIDNIPYNAIRWYADDIFSLKLGAIFEDKINREGNPIIKHLLIVLLIYKRPKDWFNIVEKYIGTLSSTSFYLGDIIDHLQRNYINSIMSTSDASKTKSLLINSLKLLYSEDSKISSKRLLDEIKKSLPKRIID